jgi:hypothetical protein
VDGLAGRERSQLRAQDGDHADHLFGAAESLHQRVIERGSAFFMRQPLGRVRGDDSGRHDIHAGLGRRALLKPLAPPLDAE